MDGTFRHTSGDVPLLELSGVSYTYPDGREALRSVDFCLMEGESVAIVGQNGAGKTTLAKHLIGVLRPTEGELRWLGAPVDERRLVELRKSVGMVFQDPDDQLFCATVYEDVAFGLRYAGMDEEQIRERVRWALEIVGLEDEGEKAPHRLSYGQRKRASMAAVLALRPEVLILDEPTSNLDPQNELALLNVLSTLSCTLIIISHDLPFLYRVCRRAVVMKDGRIHHDYTMEDLISQKAHLREHGLDFTFRATCCDGETGESKGQQVDPHIHQKIELPGGRNEKPGAVSIRVSPGARPGATPAIEASGCRYTYPDGTRALDSVDLCIEEGECVAVVGENGAGKSTLAKCLAGVLMCEGGVRVLGVPVNEKNLHTIRRSIGLLFQDPSDQLFCPTAIEDVAFGPIEMGLGPQEALMRAREALEAVGMEELAHRPTYHMSMGEKKRVAMACVLSMRPPIIILDEPTAHLDPQSAERLVGLIRRLPSTKVIIGHDLPVLYQLCHRIIVLRGGRVVAERDVEVFRKDPNLISGFGLDYTFRCSCCREIMALQSPGAVQGRALHKDQ
jgi:energy-coupling factor transporter ATP-binding protein EcfA2